MTKKNIINLWNPTPLQKKFLERSVDEKEILYGGGRYPVGYPFSTIFFGVDWGKPMPKYEIDDQMMERVENDFQYHPPKDDQQERYVYLRGKAKELAIAILENTPRSREQSVALTLLDQVGMMANAAIARNE